MKIAVLGTGNVGSALGCRWANAGHDIFFGALDPDSEAVQQMIGSGPGMRAGSCRDAIGESECVLLAIPWDQARQVLDQAESLDGKILIDCINPMVAGLSGLELGHTTSAAEEIANWFPTARVVKAFNVLSAATMQDPVFGDGRATMFYCGDDDDAKSKIRSLADELGFSPVDCGPLRLARQLEPFAMLYVHLAVFEGWGGDCAFTLVKR